MRAPIQYEPQDPEFAVDWSGLEFVGLNGMTKVFEPTVADYEELEMMFDTEPPVGDLEQGRNSRIPFDFERCYRLAEAGSSSVEVARILGVEVHIVNNNIRSRFGCGWKEYSERAKATVNGELRAKMIDICRRGDQRALLMFALKNLDWMPTQKVEMSGPRGGPIQQETLMVTMTPDELQKRRQELMKVIDRKPAFGLLGPVTPTLSLEDGSGEAEVKKDAKSSDRYIDL